MNKPDPALTTSGSDDRFIDLLAERISNNLSADHEGADDESASIDLRAIWSAAYRNRWLIVVVVAASLALGMASILLTTPTYRAEATVQIDQQTAKVLGTEDTEPVLPAQEADRFLQTQVDIIKSRALASRVADELRLDGNDSFLHAMGAKPLASDASDFEVKEQTLAVLADKLHVTLPRNSRVVAIGIDSRNPALAARIANSYADNFISSNLQRRFDTSAYSRDFLQKQLVSTKTKLEESERALIDYSRSAGLIDASNGVPTAQNATATGPRSLTTSNLVHLNQAYSEARSNRIAKQQRWELARRTALMSLPEVLGNPTMQQLSQKRAEAQAQYEQDLQRYRDGHPVVIQGKAKLAELDRQIGLLAASIRDSIREQYDVALRQEQSLAGNVGQLKGETLAEQDRSVRYNILKREVDTNRELYDGLLQRYKEVGAQAGVTTNNIAMVDRADPPLKPVSPRPLINMSLAAVLGFGVAFLLVFVRERFDDAIRAPDDVDRKLHLPLLGVVPLVSGNTSLIEALRDPRSAIAEAHQAVRSSVELSSIGGMPRTLLLTSSRQSEGKSTTAYALASDLAAAGQRILLIDADMRKPSLHRLLGLPNTAGLSNLLARQKAISDVVQNAGTAGLQFIASGPLPPSPAQLLASNALPDLLSNLVESYDCIILDGPPVLGLADAPRLAATVEGTVFVVEANGAHRGQAKSALRRLLRARANSIGAVLTKFDSKKSGFGEAYGYYYYSYSAASPLGSAAQAS
jgi:capsular exopolysaccharide synthesis family protein